MGLALIEKFYQSASQKGCLSCDTASFHPFLKRENQQAPQDQQSISMLKAILGCGISAWMHIVVLFMAWPGSRPAWLGKDVPAKVTAYMHVIPKVAAKTKLFENTKQIVILAKVTEHVHMKNTTILQCHLSVIPLNPKKQNLPDPSVKFLGNGNFS